MKKDISKYTFFLGFLGFLGFQGINNDPLDFIYFAFFGYFSNIWWYKLGNVEDERLVSNKHKAGSISFKTCFVVAIVLSITIRLFSLDVLSVYKLQVLIISLTFAIATNLWAYLTYKFDFGV